MRDVASGPGVEPAGRDTFGHDAGDGVVAVGPAVEQRRQPPVGIAEQRDAKFAGRRAPDIARPPRTPRARASPRNASRARGGRARAAARRSAAVKPGNQNRRASGSRGCGEARPCEPSTHGSALRYSSTNHAGGTARCVIAGDVGVGQAATERLDHDVGRLGDRRTARTTADLDAVDALRVARRVDARRDPGERRESVMPQRTPARARGELPREPPADARIAVVVDDLAEDVPAGSHGGHDGAPGRARLRLSRGTRWRRFDADRR